MPEKVVFLFDVDNTLLDHDRVVKDVKKHLLAAFGKEQEEKYWCIFEDLRKELGYADYLGALQNYRLAYPREPELLRMSLYLMGYHFANRLFPGSLDAVEHCAQFGPVVILTDGDVVFQPRKIERSGLLEAFEERVLIYIHKELNLDDVERRFPAEHYVMVDDKLKILAAMKKVWGNRLTTIFPKQGHYAWDPEILATAPPADIAISRIGELPNLDLDEILAAGRG